MIYLKFLTVLWFSWNSTDTKRGFAGATVFYREHALVHPQPLLLDMWWSWDLRLYHNFYEMWWKNKTGRAGALHPESSLGAPLPSSLSDCLFVVVVQNPLSRYDQVTEILATQWSDTPNDVAIMYRDKSWKKKQRSCSFSFFLIVYMWLLYICMFKTT